MRTLLTLLIASVLMSAAEQPPLVRASGEGMMTAKPDQATVTIGVTTQSANADAASQQNAKQLAAVLAQMKSDLGAKADIRTSGYSLTPNYKYGNGTAPTITGYTASNSVLVKVEDLPRLGAVIDAATKTGANTIQGIVFGLKDAAGLQAQALAKAAQNARVNAEAIAAALGLRVVRVHSAETDSTSPAVPVQARFQAMAADARMPTPVEAGTIEVRATVTIALEVAQ